MTKAEREARKILHDIGETVVHNATLALQDAPVQQEIADMILRDCVKKCRKFNMYSGNLARSYVVGIDSTSMTSLYAVNDEWAGMPQMGPYTNTYALQPKGRRHPVKGQGRRAYDYTPEGRRYKRKKRVNEFYRHINQNSRVEVGGYAPHRYTESMPRGSRLFKGGVQIIVGNYTPYRRFVEANGFTVLDGRMRMYWEKMIWQKYHMHMRTSMKQLSYFFIKGKRLKLKAYDAPVQPGRYATAKENSRRAYSKRLY